MTDATNDTTEEVVVPCPACGEAEACAVCDETPCVCEKAE